MGHKALICCVLACCIFGGETMASNSDLTTAKKRKKDEFYTQLSDIENEMRHYKQHFEGKVVLCNCDDPRSSNFFRYFSEKFESLKLKKLIATCYKSQDVDLFSQGASERAICQVYEGDKNGNCVVDDDEVGVIKLKGDGDFRSEECIEILKEADIVVTNPPFSLFRDFINLLVKYDKKFVVIGNQNAITYKEIFPLIKANKIWLGFGFKGGAGHFYSNYEDVAKAGDHRAGMIRVSGVMWFTNLDIKKRHETLPLYKAYSPEEYPRYDNYDAINIDKTADNPMDYDGVMGVPITFMDKYCPEQFEIVGMCENEDLYGLKTKVYSSSECKAAYWDKFGKKGVYDLNASGVLIKNGVREKVYQRILIRHRKEVEK